MFLGMCYKFRHTICDMFDMSITYADELMALEVSGTSTPDRGKKCKLKKGQKKFESFLRSKMIRYCTRMKILPCN